MNRGKNTIKDVSHFLICERKSFRKKWKKTFLRSFCQLHGLLLTKGTGTKICGTHNFAFLKIQQLHMWATHHAKLTWKPNCWPELSIHWEGLATCQHDQSLPMIFLGPRGNIGLVFPNCSMLLLYYSHHYLQNFLPNVAPSRAVNRIFS